MLSRRHVLSALALLALPARAAQNRYGIGPGGATIRYTFRLSGAKITGTAPLSRADIRIDPANLAASTADVSADIRKARTGLVFATDALKSPAVLDAARYPEARFVSTRVRLGPDGRISGGATIDGRLTLRGITHPIRLDATVFRPSDTPPDDLSRLSVTLRGQLSRSAYGATGYPELVDDIVALDIDVDIAALQ